MNFLCQCHEENNYFDSIFCYKIFKLSRHIFLILSNNKLSQWGEDKMVNLIIGLAIFSLAARLLYKNIQKSKQGSCPSM